MSTAQHVADALLQPAHEASYRFPAGFGGLRAWLRTDVVDTPVEVTILGPRDVALPPQGSDLAKDVRDSLTWARRELASIVAHRWPSDYSEGDGQWAKQVEDEAANAAGELVVFTDPFDSAYRVQDGLLTEVHRTAGGARFTIVIGARRQATDGRGLPTAFTVYHWDLDESGALTRLDHVDSYLDSYVEVDGVVLPQGRRVTTGDASGLTTKAVMLSGHVLLED